MSFYCILLIWTWLCIFTLSTLFASKDGNSHQILCHNGALRLQLCLPLLLLGRIQLGALAKAVKRAKDTVVVLLLMMTMTMKMKKKIMILYVRVCVGVSTSEKDRLTDKRSEKCSSATQCRYCISGISFHPFYPVLKKKYLDALAPILVYFAPVPGTHDI